MKTVYRKTNISSQKSAFGAIKENSNFRSQTLLRIDHDWSIFNSFYILLIDYLFVTAVKSFWSPFKMKVQNM